MDGRTIGDEQKMAEYRKEAVCFIRPKIDENDYYFNGIKKMGYRIFVPYRGKGLILRLLRELWFRFKIPGISVWYNRDLLRDDSEIYLLRDSLITPDFINWLRKNHPDSKLIMDYDNLASTTIRPDQIEDPTVEKWSYDVDDCRQYQMKMKPRSFLDVYKLEEHEKESPQYDVLYLGRDKGRLEYLLSLEKKLQEIGLRTYFHICANRRYQTLFNRHYKKLIPYSAYMELMKKSRAILNIVNKPQASMTMRDFEVAFNRIKGITNNPLAVQFPLYDPSRYFILGVDDIKTLPAFLDTPFLPLTDEELEPYCYEKSIEKMVLG